MTSEDIRQKAEAALAEVETVSRRILPEPGDAQEVVALQDADEERQRQIVARMEEIAIHAPGRAQQGCRPGR